MIILLELINFVSRGSIGTYVKLLNIIANIKVKRENRNVIMTASISCAFLRALKVTSLSIGPAG